MLCITIKTNKFDSIIHYYLSVVYVFPMNKPLYKLQDIFYSALWSRVKKYAQTRWMGVWSEKRVQEGRTKLDYWETRIIFNCSEDMKEKPNGITNKMAYMTT